MLLKYQFSFIAVLLLLSSGTYAEPYRIALFHEPGMPAPAITPEPDFWENMVAGLPGFQMERRGLKDLNNPTHFSRDHFDLLLIPTGASFPAAAADALISFLHKGGDLLTSGGYAFDALVIEDQGAWKTQTDFLENAASIARNPEHSAVPGGDFESPVSCWISHNPAYADITTEVSYTGAACAYALSSLDGGTGSWECVLGCQPGNHYLIGAHLKTDALLGRGYAYLAVYQYDREGAILDFTDFAQVGKASDWMRHEAAVTIHPQTDRTVFQAGLHHIQGTMWFDSVTCAAIPEEIRINAHYGKPGDGLVVRKEQLQIFSPDRRFTSSADAYAFYAQTESGRNSEPPPALHGFEATAQLSGNGHISPLAAFATPEEYLPCPGTLVFNHQGFFKDSHWALFGVDNLNFPALAPDAYREALLRLRAGVTISELRPAYVSYQPGESGSLSASVRNTSKEKRVLRVSLAVDDLFCAALTDRPEQEVALAPGEAVTTSWAFTLPESDSLPALCSIVLRVYEGTLLCDERTTGFVVNRLNRLPAACRNAPESCRFGTDLWSSVFLSPSHSPVSWSEDLKLMKQSGLTVAEMLQLCPADYEYTEEHWRFFDGFIQLCADQRLTYMAGLLIGKNVCIDNDTLKKQQALCRSFAERYKNVPDLIYYLNGDFRLDLADTEDIRALWNQFLATRYADAASLNEAWKSEGFPAPGAVPVQEYAAQGWYDLHARDLNEFKALLMNRWIQALIVAIREEDPHHPITSEYYQHPFSGIDLRNSLGGQYASNFGYFDRPNLDRARFAATARMYDMRREGKALHVGEFGVKTHDAWAEERGGTHYHIRRSEEEQLRFFWDIVHHAWALGFSQIQNWCWRDDPDRIFPWGVVWANPSRPKPVLSLWSRLAGMNRMITVQHEPADIVFVLSDGWRSGAPESFSLEVMLNALDCLLAANIPFDVVSENALTTLQDNLPKAIIFPAAYALSDETLSLMQGYAIRGAAVLLSGDPGINPQGQRNQERYRQFLGSTFLAETGDAKGLPVPRIKTETATLCLTEGTVTLYAIPCGAGAIYWSPLLWESAVSADLFGKDRHLTADPRQNLYLPFLKMLGFSSPLPVSNTSGIWRTSLVPSGENRLISLFPVTGENTPGTVSVAYDGLQFQFEYTYAAPSALLLNPENKILALSGCGSLSVNGIPVVQSKGMWLIYSDEMLPLEACSRVHAFSDREAVFFPGDNRSLNCMQFEQ